MPTLKNDLSIEEVRLVRKAAVSLGDDFGPEFEEQVEVALVSGKLPERGSFVIDPISVISVLIPAASLVWTIWMDMHRKSEVLDKDKVIKTTLSSMEKVDMSPEQKLKIVGALVEQL
jgi:hypothetical protein